MQIAGKEVKGVITWPELPYDRASSEISLYCDISVTDAEKVLKLAKKEGRVFYGLMVIEETKKDRFVICTSVALYNP